MKGFTAARRKIHPFIRFEKFIMNDAHDHNDDGSPFQSGWRDILGAIAQIFKIGARRISESDIKQVLEEGQQSGAIEPLEHELLKSILEFTDTTVKEIMVPRTDVVAVDLSVSREQLVKVVIDEGYSRMPVFHDSIDNIVGVIYTKDLLSMLEHRDVIILQDILRPPYFVPESKKISGLLRELQIKKQHMAIVVDEFGGTEGIITMEDILEEIVGEIRDEYDEDLRDIEPVGDGSVVVNAGMSIHDFNEQFHAALPEDDDYETLSGFLHKFTGRIPELHEEIRYGDLAFFVSKKNERRLRLVKVKKIAVEN
ncbi:MAG: HlyC/CorC family transporter [Bacteroidota bacterium]|nr:HlyC/CorC family transporter [Bacteroidota bacterium]